MTIESELKMGVRSRSLATDAHGLTRKTEARIGSRRTRETHRTGILDRMNRMGGNTLGSTIARPEGLSRVQFGVPPNCVTKDALNAKKCRHGKNRSESGPASAYVRLRSLTAVRASAYRRFESFAFVRIRSLTSAFVRIQFFYLCMKLRVEELGNFCQVVTRAGIRHAGRPETPRFAAIRHKKNYV